MKQKRNSYNKEQNLRRIFRLLMSVFLCFSLLIPSACTNKSSSSGKAKSSSSKAVKSVSSAVSSKVVSKHASSLPASSSRPSSSKASSAAVSSAKPKFKVNNDGTKILDVKNIQQSPELPSGCEITSACIVLNYAGCSATKTDLLKYLKSCNKFYQADGKEYGPNPWKCFVGNPGSAKYGCYAPVIADTINLYLKATGKISQNHLAADLTGAPVSALYSNIDNGTPVIVWVTNGMCEPSFGDSWYLEDTKAPYKWITGEHCMVLIGYDGNKAILSDPLDKRGTVIYDKPLFEQRYKELFSQAVAIS